MNKYAIYGHLSVIDITEKLLRRCQDITHSGFHSIHRDKYIVILDLWRDIYRHILLSGSQCAWPFFTDGGLQLPIIDEIRGADYVFSFVNSFTGIIGHYPQCPHLMKLIKLVLDVLGVNEVNSLKKLLSAELQPAIGDVKPDEYYASVKTALEWIEGMQPEIRLQHITRNAIIRGMSYRSVQGAATLELPVRLTQYLLLVDD